MGAVPQVPPSPSGCAAVISSRLGLWNTVPAIYQYQSQIVQHLDHGQLVLVCGPPGCGKTTYLPQILMDECYARNQRCRMICTQPKRLFAHINAERLAELRGETVGQTVGYQIRLESKVSPRTLLTFCTHGVLLRTIYADPSIMAGTTHILVDEIEEEELPVHVLLRMHLQASGVLQLDDATLEEMADPLRRTSSMTPNSEHGSGILLAILPALMKQHSHLKVILMVNLRKATHDAWLVKPEEEEIVQVVKAGCVERDETVLPNYPYTAASSYCPTAAYCRCGQSGHSDPNRSHDLDGSSKCPIHIPFHAPPCTVDPIGSRGIPTSFTHHTDPICQTQSTMEYAGLDHGLIRGMPRDSLTPDVARIQRHAVTRTAGYAKVAAILNGPKSCTYMDSAPILIIPYPEKTVRTFYLEDVLQWLGYGNANTDESASILAQDSYKCQSLVHWFVGPIRAEDSINLTNQGHLNEATTNPLQSKKPLHCGAEMNTLLPEFYHAPCQDTQSTTTSDEYGTSGATVSPTSRQHANQLLWSIWYSMVFPLLSQIGGHVAPKSATEKTPNEVHKLLTNLHQCILAGWFPVDYQHSSSGLTALMVCSAAGLTDSVERLLGFGADVFLRLPVPYELLEPLVLLNTRDGAPLQLCGPRHRRIEIEDATYLVVGVNAFDLARIFGHTETAAALLEHIAAHSMRHIPENQEAVLHRFGTWFSAPFGDDTFNAIHPDQFSLVANEEDGLKEMENQLLLTYHVNRNSIDSESTVDFDLLTVLIKKMDASMLEGDILIFLPSYEEIITLRERLLNPDTSPWGYQPRQLVFVLHPRMLVADLTRVYMKPTPGLRRIILACNIAESSMTFDDVAYVIDCGLDCSKTEDRWTGTHTIRNCWISQTVAIQRQTRIGPTYSGVCFRLYSRMRFEHLDHCSEMTSRGIVLEEASIQARLLTPPGMAIQSILTTVPRPPDPQACQTTIRSLIHLDALDALHEFTELGYHICDIPIPPRYSKMVLVSVALKCLDPILTIACILTYTEPFVIPKNSLERREWMSVRKKFAADSFSDHMMLLRAFQFWQKARSEGWEKSFCQKNFISTAAFEIITIIRTQLLGQLRASGFVKARGSGDIRDLNTNSENWAVVKAAIVAGMYPRLARIDRQSNKIITVDSQSKSVRLHPHSVLVTANYANRLNGGSTLPCGWLVYDELLSLPDMSARHEKPHSNLTTAPHQSNIPLVQPSMVEAEEDGEDGDGEAVDGSSLIRCVTFVSPITIALMAGPMRLRPDILRETESAIHDASSVWPNQRLTRPTAPLLPDCLPEQSDWMQLANCKPTTGGVYHVPTTFSSMRREVTARTCRSEAVCLPEVRAELDDSTYCSESDSDSDEAWSMVFGKGFSRAKLDELLPSTAPMTVPPPSFSGNGPDAPDGQTKRAFISPATSVATTAAANPYGSICQTGTERGQSNVPFRIDDTGLFRFQLDPVSAQLVLSLRQKWHSLLLRRLRNPGKPGTAQDEAVLSAIVMVLTGEEQSLGLRQPSGVGARPRPMAAELCNQFDHLMNTRNTTMTTTSSSTTTGGAGMVTTPTPVMSHMTSTGPTNRPESLSRGTGLSMTNNYFTPCSKSAFSPLGAQTQSYERQMGSRLPQSSMMMNMIPETTAAGQLVNEATGSLVMMDNSKMTNSGYHYGSDVHGGRYMAPPSSSLLTTGADGGQLTQFEYNKSNKPSLHAADMLYTRNAPASTNSFTTNSTMHTASSLMESSESPVYHDAYYSGGGPSQTLIDQQQIPLLNRLQAVRLDTGPASRPDVQLRNIATGGNTAPRDWQSGPFVTCSGEQDHPTHHRISAIGPVSSVIGQSQKSSVIYRLSSAAATAADCGPSIGSSHPNNFIFSPITTSQSQQRLSTGDGGTLDHGDFVSRD